ncbi:hypothetical protein ASE75_06055 [Sphingomonas sp. Leaf17]|uniref:hypothetical protein n=1 Tax=Sphingomonas sp. Leaf17 TaxID=1735683 RepID=UPI0006FCC8DC|nr:hypothetical protein [Sphingomonas sp. Leaf17]KQM65792.1 hypothetical protein ASE75_06055 [Sphingomonas sp. Leaf17]
MKTVTIFGPTIVNGEVRHPHEGPLTISNREAARLVQGGVLKDPPLDADGEHADDVEPPVDGDGLDLLTIAQLSELAEVEQIDISGATLKADIIAAIRAHRAG